MAEEPITEVVKELSEVVKELKSANKRAGSASGVASAIKQVGESASDAITNVAEALNPAKQLAMGIDSLKSSLSDLVPSFIKKPFEFLKGLKQPKGIDGQGLSSAFRDSLAPLEDLFTILIEETMEIKDVAKEMLNTYLDALTTPTRQIETPVETLKVETSGAEIETTNDNAITPFLQTLNDTADAGLTQVAEEVNDLRFLVDDVFGQNRIGGDISLIADYVKKLQFKPVRDTTMGSTGDDTADASTGGGGKVPSALKGLGALGKGFGGLIGGIVSGIGKGFAAVGKNFAKVIKGALAMAAIGASLIPAAKAFQMFGEVSWKAVGVGITVLAGLVVASLALSAASVPMLIGAAAIGLLGLAMIPAAKAFEIFGRAINEQLGPAIERLLPILADFAGSLLEDLVKSFKSIANTVSDFIGSAVENIGKLGVELQNFNDIDALNLAAIGGGLISLAAGLTALTVGNLLSNVGEGLTKLFTFGQAKSPLEKIGELGKAGPGLQQAADGLERLITAMEKLKEVGDKFSTGNIKKGLKEAIEVVAKGIEKIDEVKLKALQDSIGVINPQVSTGAIMEQTQSDNMMMSGMMMANPVPVVVSAPVSSASTTNDNSTTIIGNMSHINRTKSSVTNGRYR